MELGRLGVELVVVVPLVAHLHVLPTSKADSAEEANNLEESDSLVKVQALWIVSESDLPKLEEKREGEKHVCGVCKFEVSLVFENVLVFECVLRLVVESQPVDFL